MSVDEAGSDVFFFEPGVTGKNRVSVISSSEHLQHMLNSKAVPANDRLATKDLRVHSDSLKEFRVFVLLGYHAFTIPGAVNQGLPNLIRGQKSPVWVPWQPLQVRQILAWHGAPNDRVHEDCGQGQRGLLQGVAGLLQRILVRGRRALGDGGLGGGGGGL